MLTKLAKHVHKSVVHEGVGNNNISGKNGGGVFEFRLVRAIDQIELTGLIFHDIKTKNGNNHGQ